MSKDIEVDFRAKYPLLAEEWQRERDVLVWLDKYHPAIGDTYCDWAGRGEAVAASTAAPVAAPAAAPVAAAQGLTQILVTIYPNGAVTFTNVALANRDGVAVVASSVIAGCISGPLAPALAAKEAAK